MSDDTNKKLEEILGRTLTNAKPLVITDTDANTNINGYAIYAIADATFTTLDCVNDGDDLSAQTLTAGHIWYVPIKGTVELATGAVIIYQFTNSEN